MTKAKEKKKGKYAIDDRVYHQALGVVGFVKDSRPDIIFEDENKMEYLIEISRTGKLMWCLESSLHSSSVSESSNRNRFSSNDVPKESKDFVRIISSTTNSRGKK